MGTPNYGFLTRGPQSFTQQGSGECTFDTDANMKTLDALLPTLLASQVANVTLSSAQILALENTPVEIIPAPGAGKMLWPVVIFVHFKYGTTPYNLANSPTLVLNYEGLGGGGTPYIQAISSSSVSGLLTATSDQILQANSRFIFQNGVQGTPFPRTDVENQGISIYQGGGTITSGDGTLLVSILYSVISL